ncbi:hypothetical protein ACIOG8_10695 [Streptomyces erythrochromogenes]|uniref:hypothetical protein n=1 Tax=Streptomyces erythrochromogenes TaxID=285574 RepID=UPI0037F4452A
MSRMAQVLVLARYEDEVMEPLTRDDGTRTWHDCFGRWMFRDGALVEVGIPGTTRVTTKPPSWWGEGPRPGHLSRSTLGGPDPSHSPEHAEDPNIFWWPAQPDRSWCATRTPPRRNLVRGTRRDPVDLAPLLMRAPLRGILV